MNRNFDLRFPESTPKLREQSPKVGKNIDQRPKASSKASTPAIPVFLKLSSPISQARNQKARLKPAPT